MKFVVKLFAIASFAFLLAACSDDSNDNPANVAQTFFTEMLEGDAHKAVELIDVGDIDQGLSQITGQEMSVEDTEKKLTEMFTEMKKEVEKVGGVDAIKVGEVTYNNDKTEATVPVTLSFKKEMNGKKSDTQDVKLKKVDGMWKVLLK